MNEKGKRLYIISRQKNFKAAASKVYMLLIKKIYVKVKWNQRFPVITSWQKKKNRLFISYALYAYMLVCRRKYLRKNGEKQGKYEK